MNAGQRLIAFCSALFTAALHGAAAFTLSLALPLAADAQTLPFQLTKVATGYRVAGLPQELVADLLAIPGGEPLVMSLVDPARGTTKVRGAGLYVDSTSLLLATDESFAFAPDPNKTYLTFELKEPAAAGSGCSGCALTNRNLKARSPQICWCFSKLAASGGAAACGTADMPLGFFSRSEPAANLLRLLGEPGRTEGVYEECYPSSGPGGEDCSAFLAVCKAGNGGAGSLRGGGYSCDAR